VLYNVRHNFETFRANTKYDSSDIAGKSRLLLSTLGGRALFGYIARDDADNPRGPKSALERISLKISDMADHPRTGFSGYALLAAILAFPWFWPTGARRPILFALLAAAIAWLQMLLVKDVGGSVHHVVLLWPLPTLIIAVAFAEASRRLGRIGTPLLAV